MYINIFDGRDENNIFWKHNSPSSSHVDPVKPSAQRQEHMSGKKKEKREKKRREETGEEKGEKRGERKQERKKIEKELKIFVNNCFETK